ncbi:MAG TPA: serine/threonine-protein kinase, partial [candidate division Zixibacteria bacterium]|nr:serine/threonine-protein kinase [candidate division Zixibacteria bacterium]
MQLTVGTKLGPYEIEAEAGVGGMGEVYKAKDTRLDRSVAIKVLSVQIASNPDLRQRFEREAKAISSLNHPNICTLHDIGSQGGVDFLVMEYLDGETLAVKLTKGPLPAPELLTIAIQIADALDKAHKQGLVHRDLKPGNIMLTKSGAKLMDFGLAKLTESSLIHGASGITRTTPLTGEGTIIGTLQYMS